MTGSKNNNILVVALEDEYQGADLYCGIGEICKQKLNEHIWQNRLGCNRKYKPNRVINYGTCGTFIPGIKGLHRITTFSNGVETRGDGIGLKLLTQHKFVTETIPGYDLVDCEAFFLKQICDANDIEFVCYKYVSDTVGDNSKEIWRQFVNSGEQAFREYINNTDELYNFKQNALEKKWQKTPSKKRR